MPAATPLDGMLVLLVDDHVDSLEALCTLVELAGAEAVCVTSAKEALTWLAARPFDVLISDLAMPDEDGLWLAHQVVLCRKTLANPAVHLMAMTAHTRPDVRALAQQVGFEAFLTKPVDSARMVATVASFGAHLGRSPSGATS